MVKQKANADGFGKFKFELTGVGSRVVVIPEHITLDKVHELVQGLFHWENYHLWEFHDGAGRNFGYKGEAEWMSPSDDRLISPSKVCLSDVLPERGGKLRYTYDFGDDWRHVITRMADPKTPGIYCVKTEGPDGIEDIGGVWGLQCCKKDWHVPDVAEITNRLVRIRFNPKKSGTGLLKKATEELDAVIKSLNDFEWEWLRQLGEEGYARMWRKNERLEQLVSLLPGIRYLKMSSALWGGDTYDAEPEFRRYWRKMRDTWSQMRALPDEDVQVALPEPPSDVQEEIYDFACAAACLYGAVGESDLCELFDKWRGEADWLKNATEETAAYALRLVRRRMFAKDALAYVSDGLAISSMKYPPAGRKGAGGFVADKTLAEMLERRSGKKRWYPESYGDFLYYCDGGYDNSKEYDELERFIVGTWDIDKKDCLDAADLDDTMADVFYVFSTGRGCQAAVEAIREQFDMSDLSSREFSTLTKRLVNASNATRHDSNWGYTPKEMAAMYGETAEVPPVQYDFAVNPNEPVVRKEVKIGRNDPCPCGSGKKYKKCCGRGK